MNTLPSNCSFYVETAGELYRRGSAANTEPKKIIAIAELFRSPWLHLTIF